MTAGIDSIAFDIPKIHLPIAVLAENRSIEPEKLIKGLGLQKMSFPDVHQDVVTFAANAVYRLLQQENIPACEISRIYVGTESGIDSSKPVASFVASLLEQQYGAGSFRCCDVTDFTFACIGAVDALQNTLDFIRLNPEKKAIVVASDIAKYDLASTGEYTQGAGAVAMLVTANPRLLAFSKQTGVSSEGVFDFFKPRRSLSKQEITGTPSNPEWFGVHENEVSIYKEQPVFDGQYSNTCYIARIVEAYFHYKTESSQPGVLYQNWENILMHLPYCFQGRRTFVEIFARENPEIKLDPKSETYKDQIKIVAKSPEYIDFVNKTIAPSEIASGQIGNLYTGSIFMGLLSTLCHHYKQDTNLAGKKMGFIAYGSGSKAKVFEAEVSQNWKDVIKNVALFESLEQSHAMDFHTYLQLHKKELPQSVVKPRAEFALDFVEKQNPALLGARYYSFK